MTACASQVPVIVTRVEHVVIEKEVLVPVSESLIERVPMPVLPPDYDLLQLGLTYKATVIRLMIANRKLKEIGDLK